MNITKNQLQTIIREEYVKILFESRGHQISESEVKVLVESLGEGIFSNLFSKAKDPKEQERKNFAAITKTEDDIIEKIVGIRQSVKDMLEKNGYVADDSDISILGINLFRKAVEEVMKASKIKGQVKPAVSAAGLGRFRSTG